MIRGCQRKILMLKNTESPLFEEAYFILRHNGTALTASTKTNMIKEANRIISENIISCGNSSYAFNNMSGQKSKKSGKSGKLQAVMWFLCGIAASGISLGIISVIF